MQNLNPGSVLQGGKYRIERVLGQGGFGITYLAIQSGLERKVAVKEFFMKELCNRDESTSHVTLGNAGSRESVSRFREKFLKEARNIARLNHPNIVRIIDVFEENGTAYYVMEYAENGSLADKVQREGYLSEPVATRYILQVAKALDYIHQQRMNHLDVKPANIMLNEKDEPVLIDFGLSKQYDATTGNQTSTTPIGISEGYAPMEQYKQGGVGAFSPETDIYALGATFFKLLTGVTPPSASDVYEDGVPVEELKAKGASQKAIDAICKAMMGRKKARMKSAEDFANALSRADVLAAAEEDETTRVIGQPMAKATPPAAAPQRQPQQQPAPVQPAPAYTPGTGRSNTMLYAIIAVLASIVVASGIYWLTSGDGAEGPQAPVDSVLVDTFSGHVADPGQVPAETSAVPTDEPIVEENEQGGDIYVITKNMFVRTGPGLAYEPQYSPYSDFDSNNTNGVVVYKGTMIEVLDEQNGFVYARQLPQNNDRDNWGEGWISNRYLQRR